MDLFFIYAYLCLHAFGLLLAQKTSKYGDNVPVFYNLRSVLDVFYLKPNAGLPETQKILYAFENYCFSTFSRPLQSRRKPFVVIEGDHKTSTDIISRRIARRMGATLLQSVAKCLEPYKRSYSQGDPLRRAYYGLSLYANAHKVKQVYNRYPVISNGYWVEQIVFGIGNKYVTLDQIPRQGDSVYRWPSDLLKPDLIFYITFPDNLHLTGTTRHPDAWKNRMEYIYRQVTDPPVIVISTAQGFDNVTATMESIIQDKLGHLDVNFTPNDALVNFKQRDAPNNFIPNDVPVK